MGSPISCILVNAEERMRVPVPVVSLESIAEMPDCLLGRYWQFRWLFKQRDKNCQHLKFLESIKLVWKEWLFSPQFFSLRGREHCCAWSRTGSLAGKFVSTSSVGLNAFLLQRFLYQSQTYTPLKCQFLSSGHLSRTIVCLL